MYGDRGGAAWRQTNVTICPYTNPRLRFDRANVNENLAQETYMLTTSLFNVVDGVTITLRSPTGGGVQRRHAGDGVAAGQGRGDLPPVVLGARARRPAAHDHQGHRHVLHARRRHILLQTTQVGIHQVQKTSLQTRL